MRTVKWLVRASSPPATTPLLSSFRSSTASESLPPIMFWSRAAPCRFMHLARERSSITEGTVQAETPPPSGQPQPPPAPWGLWHTNKVTQGTATLWTCNVWATPQQRFLCSTSQGTSTIVFLLSWGSKLPWHYTAFTQSQRASAAGSSGSRAGSTWEGRGKEVPSALCQAEFIES